MSKKRSKSDYVVLSAKKKAGKTESWIVTGTDGATRKVRVGKSSADTIDKIAKRYAGAMKRLAVR